MGLFFYLKSDNRIFLVFIRPGISWLFSMLELFYSPSVLKILEAFPRIYKKMRKSEFLLIYYLGYMTWPYLRKGHRAAEKNSSYLRRGLHSIIQIKVW